MKYLQNVKKRSFFIAIICFVLAFAVIFASACSEEPTINGSNSGYVTGDEVDGKNDSNNDEPYSDETDKDKTEEPNNDETDKDKTEEPNNDETDKDKTEETNGGNEEENGGEFDNETENTEAEIPNQDLIIPLSEITTDAGFFGIVVDGTYMEVIAFQYGSSYRTTFNTCQVCYTSRKGYFVQSGNYLVCQNCKNKYALSNVGLTRSGYTCNPYTILESERTVTGDSIVISYEFLLQCRDLFRTWG